jgi:hypothetical protein
MDPYMRGLKATDAWPTFFLRRSGARPHLITNTDEWGRLYSPRTRADSSSVPLSCGPNYPGLSSCHGRSY